MQILKTAAFGIGAALVLALARPSFGVEMQAAAPESSTENAGKPETKPITRTELPAPPNDDASVVQSPNAAGSGDPNQAAGTGTDRQLDDSRIGAAVAKAITQAHIDQAVAKAMADAHIGEKIAAALAQAHLDQKIAEAVKEAQPQIDAAVARAQRQARRRAPMPSQSAPQ